MAAKIMPSWAYLRECFSYDPYTGLLTWRERPLNHFSGDRGWRQWNGRHADKVIPGGVHHRYLTVGLDYAHWYIHRIIWKFVTGDEPVAEIDHKDRNGFNNRWDNLREATSMQQKQNKARQRNNYTGYKGVIWKRDRPRPRPYEARIQVEGKIVNIGHFATAEEAHEAYCAAARKYFGEFWTAG
jgi:hypothetical protein